MKVKDNVDLSGIIEWRDGVYSTQRVRRRVLITRTAATIRSAPGETEETPDFH